MAGVRSVSLLLPSFVDLGADVAYVGVARHHLSSGLGRFGIDVCFNGGGS